MLDTNANANAETGNGSSWGTFGSFPELLYRLKHNFLFGILLVPNTRKKNLRLFISCAAIIFIPLVHLFPPLNFDLYLPEILFKFVSDVGFMYCLKPFLFYGQHFVWIMSARAIGFPFSFITFFYSAIRFVLMGLYCLVCSPLLLWVLLNSELLILLKWFSVYIYFKCLKQFAYLFLTIWQLNKYT